MRRRPRTRRAAGQRDDQSRRLEELRAAGWVLPAALGSGGRPTWTLVGTVDSAWATTVDQTGLVTPFGSGAPWSLDWWIGGDDRWHFPSVDTGVRQHLVGHGPVVETLVRIPGGDAVQRIYGIRADAFPGGDEWVVVEVENRSPVPFAVAFAVRPVTPEGLAPISSVGMVAVGGGQHRDGAQAVFVDGRAGLILPRRPARIAGADAATGDVADIVGRGDASTLEAEDAWTGPDCPHGLAQAAFVFPVAHTTTIRVMLPIGADPGAAPAWPVAVPGAAQVVAGWDAHAGPAMRVGIPEPLLAEAAEAARRSLLLAPWSDGIRHAGPPREQTLNPPRAHLLAGTGRIITALDHLGHHDEVARTLRRWPDVLMTTSAAPADDVAVIDAVATHRLLAGDQPLFDDLLPDVVASVARLDRAAARPPLAPHDRRAAGRALSTLAMALDASGQTAGASDVRSVAERLAGRLANRLAGPLPAISSEPGSPQLTDEPWFLLAVAFDAIASGEPAGIDRLNEVVSGASPTFGFAGSGEPRDLVASALLLDAVRGLLVRETGEGLDLVPVFPASWYGAAVELHDAPTAHGRLSYVVRWHGTRPALLWELDAGLVERPVRIAVPGLDPEWTTTLRRGEALLAEVAPPVGSQPVRLVTEHPGEGGSFA